MANHIVNDRGETVLAVGAPGSDARFEVQYPSLIEKAKAILTKYDHNNLVFKQGKPVGVMVDTSEGWCAEELTSDKWILPKEFPGSDGIYDLAEALKKKGYQVWTGRQRYADGPISLARWLHEQN